MRSLVLLALVACQSSETSSAAKQPAASSSAPAITSGAVTTTAVTPSAPSAACLAGNLAKGGDVVGLYAKGNHALACYAEENADSGTCMEIDPASSAIVATQKWHREGGANGEADAFTVTATPDAAKVCKAGSTTDCTNVKLSMKKIGERKDVIAAANEDGTRLFVLSPEQKPGSDPKMTTSWTTFGDTYEVKTGKRLFHQKITNAFIDMSNTWSARFDGKNLVLGDYVCCGPGGTSMLFDPEKGVVKRLHGFNGSYHEVAGHVHAVLDDKKLSFVDFETMQDVGATLTLPGKSFDSPERTPARAIPVGGKIVAAYANPAGAWILDGATRAKTSELAMPVCP
jgi:hypothetical protein